MLYLPHHVPYSSLRMMSLKSILGYLRLFKVGESLTLVNDMSSNGPRVIRVTRVIRVIMVISWIIRALILFVLVNSGEATFRNMSLEMRCTALHSPGQVTQIMIVHPTIHR